MQQYTDDLDLAKGDRYIQSIVQTPAGGTIIFTFQPYLANLIHSALSFEVDMTFKCVYGDLNEWEIVIWYPAVNRCAYSKSLSHYCRLGGCDNYLVVTIGRIYTDRKDRAHYKLLFDDFQKTVEAITGKPPHFKRLSKGGNLLVMNVDLEIAQVLGAGDSFLTTNEPEYSGIQTTDPEELIQYVLRLCYTHIKRYDHWCQFSYGSTVDYLFNDPRPIRDFKALVTTADYEWLINFPYLESEVALKAFMQFVYSLGIKKITGILRTLL